MRRDGGRSSRRMRTLVTLTARPRPVRSSDRMRADIHDGSEHTLQSEAGYIDARPHQPESRKPLAPHGRTIHVGQNENSPILGLCQLPPAADIRAYWLRTG